jgi:hypothetical protein
MLFKRIFIKFRILAGVYLSDEGENDRSILLILADK